MNENIKHDVQLDVAGITAELRKLQPNKKHRMEQLFAELRPVIAEMQAKHVTQKDILAVLAAKGLKLHPARFKALMGAEREEHASQGVPTRAGATAVQS